MLVKYLECFVAPMLLPVMISHCTNYWSTTTIATVLTLLMTAIFAIADNILNQIPMSCALCATGRRKSHTILSESMRISKMLLARAKNGARGKAATKIVTKPNWMTGKKISEKKLRLFAGFFKCFFAGFINPIYLTLLLFNDQNEYKVIENGHSLVNQICIYIGRDLPIETTFIRI